MINLNIYIRKIQTVNRPIRNVSSANVRLIRIIRNIKTANVRSTQNFQTGMIRKPHMLCTLAKIGCVEKLKYLVFSFYSLMFLTLQILVIKLAYFRICFSMP